jgi:glycosyltransferase involved in cell wall biosynthesis
MTGRRITLVCDELRGIAGGGLGTVYTFLGVALARLGHDVDVLYFGEPPDKPIDGYWAGLYERAGVRVRAVPRRHEQVDPPFARLLDIDDALSSEPPEVVIAQDLAGSAYVPLRRRQLGLGFEDTLFVVRCSGTRRWINEAARKVRVLPGALAITVLEQAALELADAVVAESRYMVDWMKQQSWRLPEQTHVIPSIMEAGATGQRRRRDVVDDGARVDRIAFFGRLEERKGIRPFAAAVNALGPELLAGIELEFVGPSTPSWPPDRVVDLLTQATRDSLRRISFATKLDRQDALARIDHPGTLAVMPSLEDNSPSTVYECLELGIPFIASSVGGTAELVDAGDRARVLFEPTEDAIAAALRRALTHSDGLRPARAAFDDSESLARWGDILARRPGARPFPTEKPSVDVIVAPSDGREAALRESTAEWVVFLDADDEPSDELLETLLRAQAGSSADVVTSGLLVRDAGTSKPYYFLGDPGGLGALSNAYGVAPLIRRSLLAEGTATAWPVEGDPDWPLLARLSATGARIVSVPLPLVTRQEPPGELNRHPSDALLVVQELERAVPTALEALARLAAGLAALSGSGDAAPSRRAPAVRRAAARVQARVSRRRAQS